MKRSSGRIPVHLAALAALLPLGCGTLERAWRPAASLAESEARAVVAPEPFSSERAWAHLQALAELGPRPAGSAASQAAVEYLRTRLEALGLEAEEVEIELSRPAAEGEPEPTPLVLRHLVARVPGDSLDQFVLLAHYDTSADTPGANDGASGPALLLELARQLAERPLPYQTELWFLDGEVGAPAGWPDLPPFTGSRQLARAAADQLDDVRLAVAFRQVADADLTIARDRFSDGALREAFFRAARDLGYAAAFPDDRAFLDVRSSHRAFWDAGLRSVLSIMDPWYGGEEPPGPHWGGAGDTPEHCSRESLQTVGEVSLLALRRLGDRFIKVDGLTGRAERRAAEALAPAEVDSQPVADDLAVEAPGPGGASPRPSEPARESPPAPEAGPERPPEAPQDAPESS